MIQMLMYGTTQWHQWLNFDWHSVGHWVGLTDWILYCKIITAYISFPCLHTCPVWNMQLIQYVPIMLKVETCWNHIGTMPQRLQDFHDSNNSVDNLHWWHALPSRFPTRPAVWQGRTHDRDRVNRTGREANCQHLLRPCGRLVGWISRANGMSLAKLNGIWRKQNDEND